MKIGILGSGNMGRALGMRWAMNGHQVFFGGRDPDKTREVAEFTGHQSRHGSLQQAIEFADVLLHTIRGVMPSTLADAALLDNKILIDLNNHSIPEGFAYEPVTVSFTEQFQADVPNLHVVKAFNMFAMEMFEHSKQTIEQYNVSAFLAGDSVSAKATVAELASELGFTPVDAGTARHARQLESAADLLRLLMIDKGMGAFTAISAHVLPQANTQQLGGRQASNFK